MKLINMLGYAGLLPFVALPLLYNQQLWLNNTVLLQLYQLYSALILGFMAGVLWPVLHHNAGQQSEAPSASNPLALLAVSFPVLSIIALALSSNYFLLLQALLFVLLRLAEYFSTINQHYSTSYRTLRNQLTAVVSISHVLLYSIVNNTAV